MSDIYDSCSYVEHEYMHPLLEEGYEVGLDEDIVVMTPEDVDQIYHFKIAQSTDSDNVSEIRVEMTKDDDIYYLMRFVIDSETYPTFIKTQKYKKCRFENFAQHLATILDNARTNRSSYNVIFDGELLKLQQRLEFKTVDIFQLEFHAERRDDHYVCDQAQYRYHRKISHFNDMENQLRDLLDHVEKYNPQLCSQLRKGLKYGLPQ